MRSSGTLQLFIILFALELSLQSLAGVAGKSHLTQDSSSEDPNQRPTVEAIDTPVPSDLAKALETKISDWSKASENPSFNPEDISRFLDELTEDLTEPERQNIFSSILKQYPESSLNAPLRRVVESRQKPLSELVHNLGANEEGDVLAIRKADQMELERRFRTQLGVGKEEARRLALIVGSGGAEATLDRRASEKLRVALSGAFNEKERNDLQEKLAQAKPNDLEIRELKTDLMGGIKLIQKMGPSPTPAASQGVALPEPTNGNFLGSTLGFPSQKPVLDAIRENGGKITLVGAGSRDVEEEPEAKHIPAGLLGLWLSDSQGLPVTDPKTRRQYLVDAKYHGGGIDEGLPKLQGQVSGREVRPFDLYLEGGNLKVLKGRNGEDFVATSDAFVKTNAHFRGTYPEVAEALFKKQFASDGRTVLTLPMPQDNTRHVDMNILQPNRDLPNPTVFVSTYLDQHVSQLSPSDEAHARASRRLLDSAAEQLESYVDVVRVPQLPPVKGIHYSKLNQLNFTNPSGERVAIVPDYPDYPNLGVQTDINNLNEQALRNVGTGRVVFVPSTTAKAHGSFHCMFPQVCD